ncbi:hypothetical protein DL770_006026 [Monosporascus sp. CRB-9-2]|nr:hypothetical protein DL770_006026 [Monosporascus sp. CRB-9-2]
MSLATDSRVHPKVLEALKAYHLHELSYLTSDLGPDAPLDDICAFVRNNEASLKGLYSCLDYTVPGDPTSSTLLTRSETFIPGPDGNRLRLIMYRPTQSRDAPLPAVIYFHGGGMIILSTDCPIHTSWAEALARSGLVVIAVDFRNALTPDGLTPFPAGLNDCAAAVRWVDQHREQLRISKIVLQGESGGGNLALATALKAKREDWLEAIDGVCATVPYISNAYGMPLEWRLRELPSLVECDGYLISCGTSALNAKLYDPSGEHARDPLAWPYWATDEDLRGLPPHLIVTSELDPLRDEGNAYYRKLVRAGVSAVGKVNLGVVHEGELFLRQVIPDLFLENLWAIKKFADRV